MKGHLTKSKDGWYVIHQTNESINTWYPIHPDEPIFVDKRWENEVIEFKIVTEWENGEVGVNGVTYAKMIDEVLANETSEDLINEGMNKMLAVDFAKWLATKWLPIWVQNKFMWEFDVEMPIKDIPEGYLGYKTEEQLFELYKQDRQ